MAETTPAEPIAVPKISPGTYVRLRRKALQLSIEDPSRRGRNAVAPRGHVRIRTGCHLVRNLRTVHAAGTILSGIAIGLDLFGAPRAAVAILAVVLIMFAWSLEVLRHAALTRPEPRS